MTKTLEMDNIMKAHSRSCHFATPATLVVLFAQCTYACIRASETKSTTVRGQKRIAKMANAQFYRFWGVIWKTLYLVFGRKRPRSNHLPLVLRPVIKHSRSAIPRSSIASMKIFDGGLFWTNLEECLCVCLIFIYVLGPPLASFIANNHPRVTFMRELWGRGHNSEVSPSEGIRSARLYNKIRILFLE